ncbi:MAG: 4-hydroxy-3-methylbut-2-enyl diphosphate reductase [Planctomycetota bacterium]|jgi:4-hydroxy-3-methylbut-2-enyl diphosphate reductase
MQPTQQHVDKLCDTKKDPARSGFEILRAETMGFCFGVRDALERAFAEESPEEVSIHGELVHNEEVLRQLEQKGFDIGIGPDPKLLPERDRVLITAHGISEKERERLEKAGKTLIDTTCPLVQKVHRAACQLESDGYLVLVIGKPGHIEVEGITGDLRDYRIVNSIAEVESYERNKIGVICQTTYQQVKAGEIVTALRLKNPGAEIRFVDSTCEPTRQRIAAVQDLIGKVDVLVVVGGKNSNNTRQQAVMAEAAGTPAFHVQGPGDLRGEWFAGCRRVGLTAGTSTMDGSIDAVGAELLRIRDGLSA